MNKFSINLSDGAGYSGPYINKFSSGFDTVEFFIDKSMPEDCTFAVIYSVCGDVGMATDGGGMLTTSADADSGKTVVTWSIGTEVTCDSGVVIYQVVAYTSAEDGSTSTVWYSPQGRIVVGESIDTTQYETARIAAQPSLVAQLMSKTNKVYSDTLELEQRCAVLEELQQTMSKDMADMQSSAAAAHSQISSDIEGISERLTAAEQSCDNLGAASVQHAADISSLTDRVGAVEERCSVLEDTVADHGQRIHSVTELASDLSGILTDHTGDATMHLTEAERQDMEHFFSIYTANGMLSVSAEDAAETNRLLSEVVSLAADLRIAFMTGVRNTAPDSYNRLKLLDSYDICDYAVNAGSYSADGKSLSVTDALEISKAAGGGVMSVRGDTSPEQSIWSRIFCASDASYYYVDDEKSHIRIIVLDTCSMDGVQLNWFINTALNMGGIYTGLVLSHGNLARYTNTDTGERLFETIFGAAATAGSVDISGSFNNPYGGVIELEAVSGRFGNITEVVAAIHGGDGDDSCEHDLNRNFCNIGVADDIPDSEVRALTDDFQVSMRVDATSASQINSVVRATVTDVTVDGSSAIKMDPLVWDNEVYITPDFIDVTGFDGYITVQADVKFDVSSPGTARFYIATNQSKQISRHLTVSSLSSGASEDGWARVSVVMCFNPDDVNYGKSNTYLNGKSIVGWHDQYLGETMSNGDIRNEIRLIASTLTEGDAIYYRRIAVYTSDTPPASEVMRDGISDSLFLYGGEFYNSSFKNELLQQIGMDKNCYDVFCIDKASLTINGLRFGYGVSRSFEWTIPEIVFE